MAIWNKDNQAYLTGNKTLFEAFMLADKDGNIINYGWYRSRKNY